MAKGKIPKVILNFNTADSYGRDFLTGICNFLQFHGSWITWKKWSIPFEWPDKVETFTFEKNIVKNAMF